MPDQLRGERLQIMLTETELSALDDWRFTRRMPSRAAAVRELLRLGLAAQGVSLAEPGMRSKDFGITEDQQQAARGGDGVGRLGNGDGAAHRSNGRRANGDGAEG